MTGWEKADSGALVMRSEHGVFTVQRHGEGRKYWGVTYPDGTYTHTALTQAEAKTQAESWEPDPTLVELVSQDELTHELAAAESGQGELTWRDRVIAAVLDGKTTPEVKKSYYSYNAPGAEQLNALAALHALAKARTVIESAITDYVAIARTNNSPYWSSNAATWEQVGIALGITKQGATSRYGKRS